jgi:hypothetical protein
MVWFPTMPSTPAMRLSRRSLLPSPSGSHDSQRRDRLLDLVLTIPPLREWTTDSLGRLQDVAAFGAEVGRQL